MARTLWFLTLAISSMPLTAVASEVEPLICFGTEPFWSLDLTELGKARFSTPDAAERDYQGNFNALNDRKESLWRGQAITADRPDETGEATGQATGDLVAFLRESPCSDGMSDTQHPYAVNLSLPDGRHLAGCCRRPAASEAPAPAAPPASSTGLEDMNWRLAELPGQSLAADQDTPSVRFENGRLQGFSGCNRVMGAYTLEEDRLILGNLAGSMMACAEPAMAMESRFLVLFAGELSVVLDGDRLTLTPSDQGANGADALQFEREATPTLAGTAWDVTGYNNGREAVVSPELGTQLTLGFADGRVAGSAGCNRFHGDFAVDGNRLTMGPFVTTRKLCEDATMVQERAFLAALAAVATWNIERGMLDLHQADGARALTASAAGHQSPIAPRP
ncbi:heat-inducible protein [Thiorhodovibrio winogradskyi]|uniref:Heat-inducible protein n=1 Tax=Thiorhodovibrio winogradskyi TaxID=77007 RepID=A0ABZ0S9H8_9GAMM|nr:META domain-containing protein [Thiorhodovibrio winogradskyi]